MPSPTSPPRGTRNTSASALSPPGPSWAEPEPNLVFHGHHGLGKVPHRSVGKPSAIARRDCFLKMKNAEIREPLGLEMVSVVIKEGR